MSNLLPGRLLKRYHLSVRSFINILIIAILAGAILIYLSKAASNILGDVNGDSQVNVTDLSILLTNYGKNGTYDKGDLDRSGVVNVTDLSIVLTHYGRTDVAPTPPLPPSPPPPPSSGTVVRSDDASQVDPKPLWGTIECANSSRHARLTENGINFRRLTVVDGDDFFGERCELGRNEHRYGTTDKNAAGTFWLYNEGEHAITSFDMRFPTSFPISQGDWQVVMQMKQAQPYSDTQILSSENTPILSMEARENKWIVSNHGNTKWAGPNVQLGTWTHIKWDVTYSKDPSKGRLQVTIGGTASPTFTMQTLMFARAAGNGFNTGDPIPGHLRIGLYHNPAYPGTYLDFKDVQITHP